MSDYRNMQEEADIGRTPSLCHEALTELMKELFRGRLYQSPGGKRELRVFQQELPIPTENDVDADTEDAPPPFVVVRLEGGEIKNDEDPQTMEFNLVLCGYDTARQRTGWRDVMNMREKIIQRLASRPYFGGAFTVLKPITWAVQQDDTHPYYYGVITLSCTAPALTQDTELKELL